jgi:hypothetical protein
MRAHSRITQLGDKLPILHAFLVIVTDATVVNVRFTVRRSVHTSGGETDSSVSIATRL